MSREPRHDRGIGAVMAAPLSEWLELMLAEVARKHDEQARARLEQEARDQEARAEQARAPDARDPGARD